MARREYCRAELERKLQRPATPRRAGSRDEAQPAHVPEGVLGAVLDQLQRDGWMDDRRAAGSIARAKAGHLGARRIGHLMRERGFDADLITETVRQAKQTDAEHAQALWERRFGQRAVDARERARQVRFLIARGFEPSLAAKIVMSGADVEDDAAEEPTDRR